LLLGLVEFIANRFDCAGTIRRDWPPANEVVNLNGRATMALFTLF
jgi:hypothetical protein